MLASRRRRTEYDAGVEEYDAGRTTLVVQCWCMRRMTEKDVGIQGGGWSTTLAPRRRRTEEGAGAEEEEEREEH